MIRVAAVIIALAWACPAVAADGPSVAEQALGAEVMACVQSRVALRAEIIGLQAAAGGDATHTRSGAPRSGPPLPPDTTRSAPP